MQNIIEIGAGYTFSYTIVKKMQKLIERNKKAFVKRMHVVEDVFSFVVSGSTPFFPKK